MDRAKSISSVLHGRLQRLALPGLWHDVTWAQRTPASAPAVARELAAALDDRTRALGERLAASPEPWLARQLGVLAPDAPPALREEYTRRAGIAAAYREAAGTTNPDQAASLEPHRGNPELEAMRKAVFAALEIRDEPTSSTASTAASSKRESFRANAPAPPPRPTSAASSGSPRMPKPTPTGNQPTPMPSTTTPPRPAPQPSPHSWPPNATASKPATPGTSNGPPTPTPPGMQPGKPRPNCNGAGTPSQTANQMRSRRTNRSCWPDGGSSSRRMPRP